MDHDDDGFTFAAVPPSISADSGGGYFVKGALYPIFGRPRSPPRLPEPETATVPVPLRQLLLVDRDDDNPSSPALAQQQPDVVDVDLDAVPAEMFCAWSPGWAAAASTPARFCRKSGSTGSVLRWRPRLVVGRSHSDGKEKFVFLHAGASSGVGRKGRNVVNGGEGGGRGRAHAWRYYATKGSGGGNDARRTTSFLPYKRDLVGLFANAAVFRRSYLPF